MINDFAILEEIHKAAFPNSECWFTKSSLGLPSIFFFSTIKSKDEWSGGYSINDPMLTSFSITLDQDGNYTMEVLTGQNLKVLPLGESIYAYEGIKVMFRKSKGNKERIIKRFKAWTDKRKETVEMYKNRIPQ